MTMSSKYTKRWSALLATGSAGLALLIAGCGGVSNPSSPAAAGYGAHAATSAPVPAMPAASSATVPAKPATSNATAGIPQNNGGDQDADNNGGPSDGDGNI
jgi:hypothetical protein